MHARATSGGSCRLKLLFKIMNSTGSLNTEVEVEYCKKKSPIQYLLGFGLVSYGYVISVSGFAPSVSDLSF